MNTGFDMINSLIELVSEVSAPLFGGKMVRRQA